MGFRRFIILAVICALIAGCAAAIGYNRVAKMADVAVARTDIIANEACSANNIGPGKTSQGALQNDTVLRPMDLKGYSAKGFIPAGTVLRKSMFNEVEKATLAAQLKPGEVAVSFPANLETTCGKNVNPGDKVNIIRARASAKDSEAEVLAIANDVEVKAVSSEAVTVSLNKQQADLYEKNKHMTLNLELRPAGE